MNTEQVKRQIDQMVAFIKQEANDKSVELRTRADEEYNTRVLTTVEAAKEGIRAEYDRKSREITLNQKRAQSVHSNDARLQVLLARDAVLQEAYSHAAKALQEIADADSDAYEKMISDLILQGLIKMADNEVVLRCREQDLPVVEEVLPAIPETYLAAVGRPVDLKVDSTNFLSDSSCGGIVLLSQGGRIRLENTFQSRLDIAYGQNLPSIRKALFQDA